MSQSTSEVRIIRRRALSITLIYALVGGLWIFASDSVLDALVGEPDQRLGWSILKGVGYVLATSLLLWILLVRAFRKIARGDAQVAAATAQLAESEERFRLVARATNDVIWDWHVASDTLWWSDGLYEVLGYRADAIASGLAGWVAGIHADDRAAASAALERAMREGAQHWSGSYRYLCADGRCLHIRSRSHIVRDPQGNVQRVVTGMTDTSAETVLEEQLRQAQRLESVGQLTGGVAHDFNNLLTVILGNAELLVEQSARDSGLRPLAEMIGSAAQRGAELTARLLAFARKQNLAPRAIAVGSQLTGMIDGLLRRALGEQIRIEYSVAPDLWLVEADPAQLETAVLNLCLNARDAMPDGGWLNIEARNIVLDHDYAAYHAEVRPGEYVQVSVSDTGEGIPPEVLSRVFEPFFTTKPPGKGTGLGLAMVYGFLKQSGGHVSIYSEVGEGTTVKIYLPRASGAASADRTDPVPEVAVAGSATILLVEDDELVRTYALGQLQSLGYRVIAASSGEAALQVLEGADPVDLLFTDIVMPGMNGIRLAARARELRPDIALLFTSGYTRNAYAHHAGWEMDVPLLTKPYHRAELAQRVQLALAAESTQA